MAFHDLPLADQLTIVQRGTTHFTRFLDALDGADFDGQSLLPGWSRRHLVAHMGCNAAALLRLLHWAATGIETPMYASARQRDDEIAETATLTSAELRTLFTHRATELEARWHTMTTPSWNAVVRTAQGRMVPATETVWLRTREVWIHAVDLDNSAGFKDIPDAVLESVLLDIVALWRRKDAGHGLTLAVNGRAPLVVAGPPQSSTVCGDLAAVVQWAAGRGSGEITWDGPALSAPTWL